MTNEQKKIEFVSFCIESYAQKHEISGSAVAQQFERLDIIEYLFNCYEALHTQGTSYILGSIEEQLKNRKTN